MKRQKRDFKRKKILEVFLPVLITFLASKCTTQKSLFKNKVIVYAVENSGFPSRKDSNSSYIDFYKDTINFIHYPFNPLVSEKKSLQENIDTAITKFFLPNTYPYSAVPFKFDKRGQSIYINYQLNGDIKKEKYFRLSSNDTVNASSFDYLCDRNLSYHWVVTKYTGNDTIIRVAGKKIKCWIFDEFYNYLLPPNRYAKRIYLDKISFLPIRFVEIYYAPREDGSTNANTETYISTVRAIYNRPWNSKNKKWNYPKCYK